MNDTVKKSLEKLKFLAKPGHFPDLKPILKHFEQQANKIYTKEDAEALCEIAKAGVYQAGWSAALSAAKQGITIDGREWRLIKKESIDAVEQNASYTVVDPTTGKEWWKCGACGESAEYDSRHNSAGNSFSCVKHAPECLLTAAKEEAKE